MGHKASALRHEGGSDDVGGFGGGGTTTFWSLGSPRRQRQYRHPRRQQQQPGQRATTSSSSSSKAAGSGAAATHTTSSFPPSPTPRQDGPCFLTELPVEVLTIVFRHLEIADLQVRVVWDARVDRLIDRRHIVVCSPPAPN